MACLALAAWWLSTAGVAVRPLWAGVTLVGFLGTVGLLWLEQRWAEDVNLAFFKTNIAVGFVVLLTVLAARLAAEVPAWRVI
jgi:hypothetical protein